MFDVAITDRDRKLLWGRSGNRCAICRTVLTPEGSATDPTAVIGAEAHIVAQSPDGPRGDSPVNGCRDGYANMILPCFNDHTIIDTLPVGSYTVERLHEIKDKHEAWVEHELGKSMADAVAQPASDVAWHIARSRGSEFVMRNIARRDTAGGVRVTVGEYPVGLTRGLPNGDVSIGPGRSVS